MMLRCLSILFSVFILLFTAFSAEAQNEAPTTSTTVVPTPAPGTATVVTQTPEGTTIVTPVPAAKETIVAPQGYVSCFTVAAGWNGNVWVAEHKVCQYKQAAEGVVWIDGYWACTNHKAGDCINWEWKSGHWEKQMVVY